MNGYDLDYDGEIRTILKQLGTDESDVERSRVVTYLRERVTELPPEYDETYQLFLSIATSAVDPPEQNDYDDDDRT